MLQHDGAGAQFQIGAQTNAISQQNWVHSSPKYGLRFDGQPPRVGTRGTMKENVVWKCGGIMVKGDYHKVDMIKSRGIVDYHRVDMIKS